MTDEEIELLDSDDGVIEGPDIPDLDAFIPPESLPADLFKSTVLFENLNDLHPVSICRPRANRETRRLKVHKNFIPIPTEYSNIPIVEDIIHHVAYQPSEIYSLSNVSRSGIFCISKTPWCAPKHSPCYEIEGISNSGDTETELESFYFPRQKYMEDKHHYYICAPASSLDKTTETPSIINKIIGDKPIGPNYESSSIKCIGSLYVENTSEYIQNKIHLILNTQSKTGSNFIVLFVMISCMYFLYKCFRSIVGKGGKDW